MRSAKGATLAALMALAWLLGSWSPARAEVAGSQVAETISLRRDRASDTIRGRNTRGPYTLSRRMILPGSETVYVNGARAFRLSDYQIDYVAGVITFAYPLPTGQSARVEYAFDAKKSVPNLRPLSTPLSLDLAELNLGPLARSTLQFNGMWSMPEQGQPLLTAIGMGMDTKIGSTTQVTSRFAFTPRSARERRDTSDAEASSLQIAAQTDLKGLQARVNYMRTGRAFAAAKEYKLNRGVEVFDIATAYALNKDLLAKSSLRRTEELGDGGKPVRATTTATHEVTAVLSPSSRLTVARNSQQVSTSDQTEQSTVSDRVQLEQKLGEKTTAQVRHEVSTAEKGNVAQATETTALRLDSQLKPGTRITAERVETRVEEQDPLVKTQVGLTTAGPAGLKLEGRFAQVEGPGGATQETHAARVEAAPVGGLKLSGGVTRQLSEQERLQKDAAVEVKSYLGLQLVGRLSVEKDGSGSTLSLMRRLEARMNPSRALEVSGHYIDREQQRQAGPLTRGVSVVLAPTRFLQLSGSFVENPEEKGTITPEEQRRLGVRSDLGALTLTGGYSQRLSPNTQTLMEELDLGLALQISKYDRLFGGYKLAERAQGTLLATHTYRFGYTRQMGSVFGLSLEGEYLRHEQDNRTLSGKDEARARAGINARF
ncbi:MAG: hypothetical protein QHJ73_02860 [Armatimonadota bacterium]|nr:hypothetical protein [Armatimonadota bacterium]